MYIRCPGCRASTRLSPADDSPSKRCSMCGKTWYLHNASKLGATPKERSRTALAYAKAEKIDLASAYSVLLGLMQREDAVTVKVGANESMAGDKVIRASSIALKHDLPIDGAFRVAKGEVTLDVAKRQARVDREARRRPTAVVATQDTAPRSAPVWILPVLAGLVIGGGVLLLGDEPPPPPTRTVSERAAPDPAPAIHEPTNRWPNTQIELTFEGRVTRLRGRMPRELLEAYCAADSMRSCTPVEVRPPVPHRPGVLMGVLSRSGAFDREEVIWIRRGTDGVWFAGNGAEPLEPSPAG